MTTTAEIESALAEAWTIDNLAVYGDHLQQLGDPRGELIAVDVHIARHGRTPEVEHRRRRAIRTWLQLPEHVDPTRGAWEGVRFAFGFVDDLRVELASRILASRAGPYVRGVTFSQRSPTVVGLLAELAAAPRPWLARVTLLPRSKGIPPPAIWRSEPPSLQIPASLIAMTPRLARVELAGHRLLGQFPHPHVTSLRVDGIDAFLPILESRSPMPSVTELELGFARAPGELVLMKRPWPPLAPTASFPALRRLDLSANETQRAATDTQLCVFDTLTAFADLDRIIELRVPAIRTAGEREQLRRAIRRMPALRRLEVMRGHLAHELGDEHLDVIVIDAPWPPWGSRLVDEALWVQCANTHPFYGVVPRALLRHCDRSGRWFDAAARDAWAEVWRVIGNLTAHEGWQPMSAAALQTALEAVGFLDASFEEVRPWAALRERLRAQGGKADVTVIRQDTIL